jgi:hypothetical protein
LSSSIVFYGLLHVATEPTTHVNLAAGSSDPIDIYLRCAGLCGASVAAQGGAFALITNAADLLEQRCAQLGISNLSIVSHPFAWAVPHGIAFHSAHFKLELIEAFATGRYGQRVALIDIDTVLHQPFRWPELLEGCLFCYDISDQVFAAYGRETVIRDLNLVAGRTLPAPRWFGGEFICADTRGFAALAHRIADCWPRYKRGIAALHHCGDEMVASAALNMALASGQRVIDVGREGGVARWWTSRTRNRQQPFTEISNRSLLHLPGDKQFLANYPTAEFNGAEFVRSYRRYARKKLFARRAYNLLGALAGRDVQHVASL